MNELVQMALMGTARMGAAPAKAHPMVEGLLTNQKDEEPEDALLQRAGLEAVLCQAGRVADEIPTGIEPAPLDAKPCGSSRLAGLLQNAFATDAKELLSEFLGQMAAGGILLPYELLPQALNVTDASVREALAPVLGERGRWLSRFQSDWAWVEAGVATLSGRDKNVLRRTWEEGAIRERVDALATLRQSDAAEARRWLEDVLSKEKADHRARLVSALDQGLSSSDEPFLETCLDDRSSQVKEVAAALLARLPASALAQRMQERADSMLMAERKGVLRKKLKLACVPPEEIDKSWKRDGIAAQAPAGRGKRAYWTETVLSAVPPSHWPQRFESPATALIEAIEDDPFESAVLSGWTRAAASFAGADTDSTAWLAPLWEYWAKKAERMQGQGRADAMRHLENLITAMPPAEAEKSVEHVVAAARKGTDAHALSLLSLLHRPWSAEFSNRYIGWVREVLKSSADNRSYQWANTLFIAAKSIPPASFAVALAPWEVMTDKSSNWYTHAGERETERFCEIIRMRQSFCAEVGQSCVVDADDSVR